MPDKQGITHMFIPPRDDDRNVVSQTIGLVNKELRTLREQLAMRAQAGESFDWYTSSHIQLLINSFDVSSN